MNKTLYLIYIVLVLLSCNNEDSIVVNQEENEEINISNITKPKGLYSSSLGGGNSMNNSEARGSLIRVKWSELEPQQGVFDFSKIDSQVEIVKAAGKEWSLGLIGGSSSPSWLIDEVGADSFEILFRNEPVIIPKIWDVIVNQRLATLAEALANKYNNDSTLTLVYIPQMTSNGLEGHFNGVQSDVLLAAGFTPDLWVESVKETARIFATTFTNKAIAVELHEILQDVSIPERIMNDLWNDPSLEQRVGAAMWWLSGKTSFQTNLVNALTLFPGDIYAQVIGRSDQTDRFENDDYTTVFEQAKAIGIRYIEPWEYEFVNDTFPVEMKDFNDYVDVLYE